MDHLVELVGKLQEVFSAVDASDTEIDLPQIVVVGDQSAGKSSLIERIVGHDLLPRGTGIVTRMPLVLHLRQCLATDPRRESFDIDDDDDFAVFDQEDAKLCYYDFSEVTTKIDEITNREAGGKKGVINKPILLSIYSSRVVDLSLVDLPGLTQIPVHGQPHDIPQQIETMVRSYIENPNSIILAAQSAEVDIATSRAIKLAQSVDPEGDRTLLVLTKLDLAQNHEDTIKALTGQTLPIKLGIVGVVNRGQENSDMSIDEAAEHEAAFIASNYPGLVGEQGSEYLKSKLHMMSCANICYN